jgi:hypothetical protein
MKKATKEEDKTRRWCVWGGGVGAAGGRGV